MSDSDDNLQSLTPKKEEILSVSARLFAENGYAAVSMRELASETKMTPAALYHHYTDKEALYYAVLRYVFTDKASAITNLAQGAESIELKLKELIVWVIKLFSSDAVFTRLLHRELLDGDNARIKFLSKEIIEPPFLEVEKFIQNIVPHRDARSLAVSAFSLILGHFQITPILQNMSGQSASGQPIDQDEIFALADTVSWIVLGTADPTSKNSGKA